VKHLFTTLLVLAFATLNAQETTHTVFLVGDAGKSATPGKSLTLLAGTHCEMNAV
jgi:hypothetical protein